jgi:hypothetical protein
MNKSLSSLEVLKGFARIGSPDVSERMPRSMVSSVMVANNRRSGGGHRSRMAAQLRISEEAMRESLSSKTHIVAVADDDGSLRLTFASKEEIIHAPAESVPL